MVDSNLFLLASIKKSYLSPLKGACLQWLTPPDMRDRNGKIKEHYPSISIKAVLPNRTCQWGLSMVKNSNMVIFKNFILDNIFLH